MNYFVGMVNANSIIAEPISLSRYKDLKDASSDDHENQEKQLPVNRYSNCMEFEIVNLK